MTFSPELLAQLRAARAQVAHPPSVAQPEPQTQPQAAQVQTRPSVEARRGMAGHCGTCRAFTLTPSEGRYLGQCSHGRGAFDSGARHSARPVLIHESARCMTEPFPRWALRAGVSAAPDSDFPREVQP